MRRSKRQGSLSQAAGADAVEARQHTVMRLNLT